MVRTSTLLAAAVAAGVASAQINIPGISNQCASGVVGLALGPLSCLQLTGLVPILSDSGSIIPGLTSYLGNLCPAGPVCTPDNLASAKTTVDANCAADANSTGTGQILITVVDGVLAHYPEFFAGICAKNTTTNKYCVPELLQTVQDQTHQNVTLDFLGGLISGNATTLATLAPLGTSGQVCTGCLGAIYYELDKANVSITTSQAGSALKGQCGANFGASIPSGVAIGGGGNASTSGGAAGASSSAPAPSASNKPSGAAAGALTPLVIAGVSFLSVVVGAAAVL